MNDYRCLMCCGHRAAASHLLREMMFGSREEFEYMECADCGSLQIAQVPTQLSDYYPSTYYSFREASSPAHDSRARQWLRRQRAEAHLGHASIAGRLISNYTTDYFDYPWEWFRRTNVRTDSRILDVGCGDGTLLKSLQLQGFTSLFGVDPFRSGDQISDGLELRAATVFDITGEFDLVCAHHSLEHMWNVRETLERMRDLTKPGGYLLIRVPVVGDSWRNYGANWVELDAPRHLFLPTRSAFEAFIGSLDGLALRHVECDTSFFEIAGSELYRMGIPLYNAQTGARVQYDDHFDADTLARFRTMAADLNTRGTGGRAAFYVQRVSDDR